MGAPASPQLRGWPIAIDALSQFIASPSFYSPVTATRLPAEYVNPDLTAEEDFADVLGARAAFAAYTAEPPQPLPPRTLPQDMTSDQLFFIALAQNLCGEPGRQVGRLLAETEVHTPPRARVNAMMSLLPEFAATFGCTADAHIHPKSCEF